MGSSVPPKPDAKQPEYQQPLVDFLDQGGEDGASKAAGELGESNPVVDFSLKIAQIVNDPAEAALSIFDDNNGLLPEVKSFLLRCFPSSFIQVVINNISTDPGKIKYELKYKDDKSIAGYLVVQPSQDITKRFDLSLELDLPKDPIAILTPDGKISPLVLDFLAKVFPDKDMTKVVIIPDDIKKVGELYRYPVFYEEDIGVSIKIGTLIVDATKSNNGIEGFKLELEL